MFIVEPKKVENLITVTKRADFDKLASSFTAKVNDGSHKLLTDILSVEKSRVSNRFDSSNQHLINFEVVDTDRGMALKNKFTNRVYILTANAVSNLFAKVSYVSTDKKEEVGNNFENIIPEILHQKVIDTYNRYTGKKNRVESLKEIKHSLYRVCKDLSSTIVVQIFNNAFQKLDVAKEAHQIKYQQVEGVGYIRAILDLKYKNFDVVDLLESLQEFFDTHMADWRVIFYHSDIFGDNFNLRIARKIQNKKDVTRTGEPLEYALTFNTSNTGKSSCSANISVTVLKCLNGMTGQDVSDSFELIHNRSDKETFKRALDQLLKQAEITWSIIENKYNLAKTVIVDDAKTLIDTVCKDYSLGKEVSEKILNEFKRDVNIDGVSSLFKVIDAFTWIGHTHYNINQQGFHLLEKIGSDLLFDHVKFLVANGSNN